ncbi:MAG: hypothetical protein GEU90_22085 [Gemmatimonas sp.]|nr:hypothetical protein [Gemmatimonas sp.]
MRTWEGRRGAHQVRYEDLHRDGTGELSRLIVAISGRTPEPSRVAEVLEEYSFARQAGRAAGEEDRKSFLRKGIVGDWQNQFSAEARETFDRVAGDELIRLGYESDRRWVGETGSSSYAESDSGRGR